MRALFADHKFREFMMLMFLGLFGICTGAGLLWYALAERLPVHPLAFGWCVMLIVCSTAICMLAMLGND